MNYLIAQLGAEAAAKEVGSLLSDRSDAMVILAMMIGLVALWVWKVVIPERAAKVEAEKKQIETQAKLADAVVAMGKITGSIHETTTTTATKVAVMLKVMSVKIECIRKLANVHNIDVSEELAQIKGMLHISDNT